MRGLRGVTMSLLLLLLTLTCGACFAGGSGSSEGAGPPDGETGGVGTELVYHPEATATAETAAVAGEGDAADDPAIWVHPTDPALSTVLGTDKRNGLYVYDLSGQVLQFLADGNINNVDLRQGFRLAGREVTLVAVTNRSVNEVQFYTIDPASRRLERLAGVINISGGRGYGLCMYHPTPDDTYVFVTFREQGLVEQWRVRGDAGLEFSKLRSLLLSSVSEGCVADDAYRTLYVAEEAVGIWRFGADPTDPAEGVMVDKVSHNGPLQEDVEGLALYLGEAGAGYLIASSQGNDSFVLYERQGNARVHQFTVAVSPATDAVSHTDGVAVTSASLGDAFPHGLLVVQDDENDDGNQNFKYVPWQAVVETVTTEVGTEARSNETSDSETNSSETTTDDDQER